MGAAFTAGSVTVRAQARGVRARAASLRRDAQSQRRRNAELCEQLAKLLLKAPGRPFGGRGERFTLRLGCLSPMLRFARHDLRGWLEAARLPKEVVDDVALAFSEACANAIEHPQRPRRNLVEIEGRRSGTHIEPTRLRVLD
jgi:Histidine kinase-like ATPase domain